MSFRSAVLVLSLIAVPALAAPEAPPTPAPSGYVQTNYVSNKKTYKPNFAVEKGMVNAWGIAKRPVGAGGHFWVAAKETSFEYVGDVKNSNDEKNRALHTDKLKYVKIPKGGADNVVTGVVFSDSARNFVITQKIDGADDITAPAKFLFASDGGIISAWTERKKEDGTFDRAPQAETVIDRSKEGAQYFGLTLNDDYSRLYAANFGVNPGIEVFDGNFKPMNIAFDQPFDDNHNGKVDPGEYAPFNVQALTTPQGEDHIFVTYAKTQACPKAEIRKGTCKEGELFVGEEDTSKPGNGRLAEFTEDGRLYAMWDDAGQLSAPWGVAFAPSDFGPLSGMLLVANFGDGHIAAFDPVKRKFTQLMLTNKGKLVTIDKIWGLMFGNGESLGDANALYFTAGPQDEKDGVFGSLRPVL
jgi:uncharacterized protein (TIGR03118 family)